MQIRSIDVAGQLLRVGLRPGSSEMPPLLVFNGIGANLELLEPFVAAQEDVEIIVFDVPGIGGSPLPPLPYRLPSLARLASALLRELGYRGLVDVIGISWGGALAQQFAHLYPDHCRCLILASTSPGFIMVPGKLSALAKLVNPRRYSGSGFPQPDRRRALRRRLPPRSQAAARGTAGIFARRAASGYFYRLLARLELDQYPPGCTRCPSPRWSCMATTTPSLPLINARILASLIPNAKALGHRGRTSLSREPRPPRRRR